MLKLPIAAVLVAVVAIGAVGFPALAHAEPSVLEIQRTDQESGWVEVSSLERDAA
ncbi:MAG: hypothetical protein HC897_12680, partial [Thermoanaerobaculia bacterium]|nr:hypothetical protein [Thermoanaerobaculia bacterium]